MPKRDGPASARAVGRASFGNAWRQTDTTSKPVATDLSDARFKRAVGRLHRLGPRPLYELLIELGASRMVRTEIEATVERYLARLDPSIRCAVGADQFAPLPLHLVVGEDG